MKNKLLSAFMVFAVVYLLYHAVLFYANEPYRNRYQNEDYLEGRTYVTYYKPIW